MTCEEFLKKHPKIAHKISLRGWGASEHLKRNKEPELTKRHCVGLEFDVLNNNLCRRSSYTS